MHMASWIPIAFWYSERREVLIANKRLLLRV
jgi:hypothetical protein